MSILSPVTVKCKGPRDKPGTGIKQPKLTENQKQTIGQHTIGFDTKNDNFRPTLDDNRDGNIANTGTGHGRGDREEHHANISV